MTITAYAPASIGNVSLGFDLLGAALKPLDGSLLGDQVSIEAAEAFSLHVEGRFAHKLPSDSQDNIVTRCYDYFLQQLCKRDNSVLSNYSAAKLTLNKALPIGSGLGSSASSIVAALYAINEFYSQPFSAHELLLMMGQLEGEISGSIHYDNVAPCLLGGLTLMSLNGEDIGRQLPVFENWYWVVCYSGLSVSTAAARNVLPKQVDMATTINFGRQLAVFVDALHRQDEATAADMIQDVIAEPYRKSLLPNFDQARTFAMENGAHGFGISGSGPTVFAVADNLQKAERIQSWLEAHYKQNENGFSHVCQLDMKGTVCL